MFQLLIHLNLSACIEECKSISRGFNLHQVNCVCEPEASPVLVCRLQNLFLNLSKTFIFLGRQTLLKKTTKQNKKTKKEVWHALANLSLARPLYTSGVGCLCSWGFSMKLSSDVIKSRFKSWVWPRLQWYLMSKRQNFPFKTPYSLSEITWRPCLRQVSPEFTLNVRVNSVCF